MADENGLNLSAEEHEKRMNDIREHFDGVMKRVDAAQESWKNLREHLAKKNPSGSAEAVKDRGSVSPMGGQAK